MPGIAGLIGQMRREEAVRRVQEMLEVMNDEPFYSTGLYVNEQLGLYAGWVVHRNSFCDCMPARSEDGSITLLLHGEVFTSDDQLAFLRRKGHRLSESDASHLVPLYDELGDGFFEKLNGMFCGVVANSRTRKLQLFNDRLGFEKMYCCEEDGVFHFSSQAKSLLQVIPRTRQFDRQGLAQFLAYGCTLDGTPLYKGVSQLPPGSVWEFAPKSPVRKRAYFQPEDWQIDRSISSQAFQESFNETFRKVLPKYFEGKLSAGISLTGGWDTRMIMAGHHAQPGQLPCYTFAGLSGETADVRQARKVAEVVKQNHSVLRLQEDFLTNFAQHAEKTVHVSDGYGGVCLSHEIYLNRLARGIAGFRVTGNFGSEVLRGMSTFKQIPLKSEWFHGELRTDISGVIEGWTARKEPDATRFAIFKEIPWKHMATVSLANSQLPVRSPFLDNEILKLACVCPPSVRRDKALPISWIRSENSMLLSVSTDRGESGESSLFGAFAQAFCSGTFKLDYLLCEGMPDFFQAIVDPAGLHRMLPLRHKYLDYRRWFRGPLRGYVEAVLGSGNTFVSGLVGRKAVERMLRDNASGARNELSDINALMTLELIHQRLFQVHPPTENTAPTPLVFARPVS
jgi:asparagine synthase (glutamine-hydrolysing)